MSSRFSLALVLLLLVSSPLFAANRFFDLDVNAVWVDPNSNGTFDRSANRTLDIDFKGDLGYGAAANVFFGNTVSLELAASRVRPKANLTSAGLSSNNNRVSMVPITAVLQWHFAPNGFIDPYIGGGAAYVLFNDIDGARGANDLGVNRIRFKDDAGFAADAGLSIKFGSNMDIHGDVKYVPLKSSATAVFITGPNSETRVKINPVIATAGVGFRF
ncbi:MAG TPA: OmpW family outer membrane protein [Thermoanaerobaculia bacterium]|nr:OmpW family outer membrane protein [Thermoanaerobaculia bacterium]